MLKLLDNINYTVSSPIVFPNNYLDRIESYKTDRYFYLQNYRHYFIPKDIEIPPNIERDYETIPTARELKEQYKVSKLLKRKKRFAKQNKVEKKNARLIIPALIGFLTATSLLIPIGIKALILVSTKAVVLVLLSTLTALFIRLRGVFGYQQFRRRSDRKSGQIIPKYPNDINYYYKT